MASVRSCCLLLLLLILATIAVFQPGAEAQIGSIIVSGIVRCSTGGNGGSAPVFPNATVLVECGRKVIGSTTTTIAGVFRLQLSNVVSDLLDALVSDCVTAVVTPLSKCNPELPAAGILRAPMKLLSSSGLIGGILSGVLGDIGVGDFIYSSTP